MSFQTLGQMTGQRNKGFTDNVNLMNGSPPPYAREPGMQTGSRWHPRNWGRKILIGVAVAIVVIIIVVVVAAVEATKSSKYPSYSKLSYSLKDTYEGTSFFDDFEYFTGYDPAAGFVHYVDQPGSAALNLTSASSSSAVLRVDTSDPNASTGRKSVRITSKKQYNSGLFVFDILHTPYGCSTWPALWLSDPNNWPMNGEIDVVEAVNSATTGNQMTLHTTKDCKMEAKRKQTGKTLAKNCYNGTDDNAGCGVQGKSETYGEELNKDGGGVYAMEWRSDGIRVWFFQRSSIPTDISAGTSPDPSSWGEALADFPKTDCSITDHFRNQSIIANIDLCGQFAGSTKWYTTTSKCPGTCNNFVTTNATAFDTAYWEFKSFKVYDAAT